VDGLLQDGVPIHKSKQAALISRIKVLVNLDIAESRLPQDGRTNLKIGKKSLDLRVSTLPTLHGEKAVIRLLNRSHAHLGLEELGMEKDDLNLYKKLISRRNGLILVTGPTGSGKTTTLYATLSVLNSREANITTIEDPVEYQLPGINQIQINPKAGLTFARGLRSILRQDPDIIMLGEIRDLETAKVAVQAAMTGHLVFSTLHTNDAPSAVTRLVDMGIERYLVEDAVVGVVAQRLVRKISSHGYKGRTGLYEIMPGTSPRTGMKTLAQNGNLKIKGGTTSREEIARVIYLES
jgi:type II secretory ATPase GspE/PulE/Tfp pilus assembly ATPase PilB-like protein